MAEHSNSHRTHAIDPEVRLCRALRGIGLCDAVLDDPDALPYERQVADFGRAFFLCELGIARKQIQEGVLRQIAEAEGVVLADDGRRP